MDIDQIYRQLLIKVLTDGKEVSPRGLRTKELFCHQVKLEDSSECILNNKVRDAKYHIMLAEWFWIMFGYDDLEFIKAFNRNMARYSDDERTLYGAYGPRFVLQLQHVVDSLTKDPDTRQAVMTFWRPSPAKTKDTPCTVGLHFIQRDGKLHLCSWMRSNDLWLGFPYDTYVFCQLLNLVASLTGMERGSYTLTADSLHLYEEHWAKAKEAIWDENYSHQSINITSNSYESYLGWQAEFELHKLKIIKGMMTKDELYQVYPHGIASGLWYLNIRKKEKTIEEQTRG